MPNLKIPQRLSMSGPQSQSKCRCFPPNPPFRPGLADQTGSPLASRDVRAAVTQGPSGTPPRQSVNINPRTRVRLHHSRVLLRLTGTPPHRRRGSIVPASPSPCVEHLWIFRVGPWILRCPERDQLSRQRGADVTVYTHAPFGASRQTPEANDLPTSQNTICI